MSINKELCDSEKCLSCMACYCACPVQAIDIIEDNLCELKPVINEEKCISCRRCHSVCPIINKKDGNYPKVGYAACSNDAKIRLHCSSGGIASTLYHYFIENDGLIVGAKEKGMTELVMECSTQKDSIKSYIGSKYVYANPGKVYSEVEEWLKKDKQCLFIGTPCQVDALNHYLGRVYENLLTVDIICHGTPPYEYLKQHINNLNNRKRELKSFSFRGEYDFNLVLYDRNDNIVYRRKQVEDHYFYSFLHGLIHRRVCYSCPYANTHRVSDITIGDYWGAPKCVLGGYKGRISAVLVNTDKGIDYWGRITPRLVQEKADILSIVQGNSQLLAPSEMHPDREAFEISLCEKKSFRYALQNTSIPIEIRKNRIRNRLLYIPRFIKHSVFKR